MTGSNAATSPIVSTAGTNLDTGHPIASTTGSNATNGTIASMAGSNIDTSRPIASTAGSNATTGPIASTASSNAATSRSIASTAGSNTDTGRPSTKEEAHPTNEGVGPTLSKKKALGRTPTIPKTTKLFDEKTAEEIDASVKTDVDNFFTKVKAKSEAKQNPEKSYFFIRLEVLRQRVDAD
jgi:hypothetical protein